MRLQKYLAQCGVASRRASEKLIAQGHVAVNGDVVTDMGVSIDPETDAVWVDGQAIRPQRLQYLLFYKPTAVVTTMNDPEGRKCVADFFPVEDFGKLFPVGRLDYETEGLLLMTNDGELAQRLTHPSHEVEKVYEVIVNARMDEEAVGRLRKGVALSEGMTAPAKVTSFSRQKGVTHLTLVIHEGRNRQVRRMIEAVGYSVQFLRRIQEGPLRLGDLKPGEFRPLTRAEIQALK
jgi:23S rRNA pseudouridine2605 synthase